MVSINIHPLLPIILLDILKIFTTVQKNKFILPSDYMIVSDTRWESMKNVSAWLKLYITAVKEQI